MRSRPFRHCRLRHGPGWDSLSRAEAGPRGLHGRQQRARHADKRLRSLLPTMIKAIDRFLDHQTMYRLVLYYLVALMGTALALSLFRLLPHDPVALVSTTIVMLIVCWITNRV